MIVTQLAGTVEANSTLPKWEDVFKSQVDPNKRTTHDTFDTNLGALDGRVTSGKTWTRFGTGGGYWTVYSGYAAQNTASSSSRIILPHATSGKYCGIIEWQDGYIGLLIRTSDSNNFHQIVLNPTGLLYTKVVAGASTALASKALPMVAGSVHSIGIEWNETNIKIWINDELAADVNDTELASNINIGLATSNPLNKVFEIAAR